MSIALDFSSRITEIQPSRYTAAAVGGGGGGGGRSFIPNSTIFDSPVDRRTVTSAEEEEEEKEDVNECSTSSSYSSIGKNSDLSSSDGEEDENEVQSNYKRTFDCMDSLEEALPMRRGISMFYNGKSKSFTSLAEATSSSSIKEIAKADNAYTRKRRNLLAHRGISKRTMSSSKSTLALAVAMSSSESIMSSTSDDSSSCSTTSNSTNSKSSPPHLLPPLHPRSSSRASHHNLTSLECSQWRSFSVADLQHCVSATSDKFNH